MFRRTHEKTPFAVFPFSDEKYNYQWMLASEVGAHKVSLVAERDSLVVGVLWASCGRYFVSEEGLMTTVHGIVLDNDLLGGFGRVRVFRRLVKSVQKWSASRGSHFVLISNSNGFSAKTTDRLLRGIGGKTIGGSYVCISS